MPRLQRRFRCRASSQMHLSPRLRQHLYQRRMVSQMDHNPPTRVLDNNQGGQQHRDDPPASFSSRENGGPLPPPPGSRVMSKQQQTALNYPSLHLLPLSETFIPKQNCLFYLSVRISRLVDRPTRSLCLPRTTATLTGKSLQECTRKYGTMRMPRSRMDILDQHCG